MLPTGHDVIRIAEALALPLASFVSLRGRPQAADAFRILIHDERGQPLYHRMELGKVAESSDSNVGYASRCTFLMTIGGRGRCGIYAVRPALCAAFPAHFQDGVMTLVRVRPFCPKGSWRLGELDAPAHRQTQAVMDTQTIIFGAVIDAWNRHVQVQTSGDQQQAGAFFAFLHAAYNVLRKTDPTLFSDPARPIDRAVLPELVATRLAAQCS